MKTQSITHSLCDNIRLILSSALLLGGLMGAVPSQAQVTNTPPMVRITSPSNRTVITVGSSLTINANAADANGTVRKVEFYQYGELLGTDTTAPYSYTWANVGSGTYDLTAKATDNAGATTTSEKVYLTVGVAALYNNCSYGGDGSAIRSIGDYGLSYLQALGINENDLSSLRVAPGYEIQLFAEDNFQGESIVVVGDNDCLTARSFDNKVSSIRVRTSGLATLYPDCSYSGRAATIPAIGSYSQVYLQALGLNDNVLSSLRVASGYEVELFAEDDYKGASIVLSGNTSCLGANGWNDRASSLKVRAVSSHSVRPALAAAHSQAGGPDLGVYPNPAQTQLNLHAAEAFVGGEVRIRDLVGRQVWSGSYQGVALPVAGLKAGQYLLELSHAGTIRRLCFAKQ
ncbi:Ig-like domain-containing protein [Hymenobacter terrenus]|uniref:Ig-like domain-containing protein n=1 Tax=Hymenobacter terrenus TaxID=1629124 RepID=UPI0006191EF7|nr:Ig-like domain-containing protein [Hymenobacter terrenus]